jgi:hypothetical protein
MTGRVRVARIARFALSMWDSVSTDMAKKRTRSIQICHTTVPLSSCVAFGRPHEYLPAADRIAIPAL